jgi:hypothetical protein
LTIQGAIDKAVGVDNGIFTVTIQIAEIERLQRIEKQLKHAIAVLADTGDRDRFIARVRVGGSR